MKMSKDKMDKKALLSKVEDDLLLSDPDDSVFDKGKETRAKSSKTSKSKSSGKTSTAVKAPSAPRVSTSKVVTLDVSEPGVGDNANVEMLNLLKQIRDDQNKTNENVENMNKRIDYLYDDMNNYYDDEYDPQYDENDNEIDNDCDDVQSQRNGSQNDASKSDEPPAKKQKTDESNTRFSSLGKRFRSGEKCDTKINADLADNITDIFRNGISAERYKELIKDDKMNRPENCDGLVTVHTDQMIWDLLFPATKTNDNKMKNIQTIIVKGAIVLTKVVNKLDTILETDASKSSELSGVLEDCMDSVALMGHANRQICLLRREMMKPDVLDDYGHLFNQNVSYDKFLFGGDVPKKVDDIGKCNRIANRIRGGGYRGGFRGGFGRGYGRFRGGRGGHRGSVRGRGRLLSRQNEERPSGSKNSSRWSYNKYRQ